MQNLILSFILLLIGCGSNQTENLAPCIVGTFGNNKPEYQYLANSSYSTLSVEELERKITFKSDGTGVFFRPAYKSNIGQTYGQWEVFFSYKTDGNKIKITVNKFLVDVSFDVEKELGKESLSIYLKNLGIFKDIDDEIKYGCNETSITITNSYFISFISNMNGTPQIKNESDTKPEQWIKRN
jgi:hypothetical protein